MITQKIEKGLKKKKKKGKKKEKKKEKEKEVDLNLRYRNSVSSSIMNFFFVNRLIFLLLQVSTRKTGEEIQEIRKKKRLIESFTFKNNQIDETCL
jgi:hypothetical protein